MKERPNVCKSLHLPAQSGSSAVLARMRRGYTREAYLQLVDHVRSILPGVGLSSDFIAGKLFLLAWVFSCSEYWNMQAMGWPMRLT